MPVFARRRLQAMLNELGPWLTIDKAADLLSRLEDRRTEQALAAEFELALLWAIGQVADLIIEPRLDAAAPDAMTNSLFHTAPASR